MLNSFILNGFDVINIIYLWDVLNKKNRSILKLLSSIVVATILITMVQQLDLGFIVEDLVTIMVIKLIYKMKFKDIILALAHYFLTKRHSLTKPPTFFTGKHKKC